MDRGMTGVLPRTPTLEDESYLDFMEDVRNFAIREMFPVVGKQVEAAVRKAGLADDGATVPYRELGAVADPLPLVGVWKRIMRSQQQITQVLRKHFNRIFVSLLFQLLHQSRFGGRMQQSLITVANRISESIRKHKPRILQKTPLQPRQNIIRIGVDRDAQIPF